MSVGRHTYQEDTISRSSVISNWLDGHPDLPYSYESIATPAKITRKRQRVADEHSFFAQETTKHNTTSKRRKLENISGNAMPLGAIPDERALPPPSQKPPPVRSSARQVSRNAKRYKDSVVATAGGQSTAIAPTTPRRTRLLLSTPGDTPESLDEDPTPRAGASFLSNIPILQHPCSPDRSSTQSSHSVSSSTRVRSDSPSKLGDLQLSHIRVKIVEGNKIPTHGEALWRDLKRFGRGNKVIPWSMRHEALLDFDVDDEDTDRFFDPATKGEGQKLGNDTLSHEECWTRAVELHSAARECRNQSLSEAAWNSEVHSTLIRLALRGQWRSKGVWYRDVTSARIRDKSLLPTNKQSKMVDYVLVIEPDAELEPCIRELMIAKRLSSVSHAECEYLRFLLIGLSIETKRASIDEDKAEMQVATWIRAHYAKLQQLAPSAIHMPVLPLIIAQGHNWNFMLAEMAAPDNVVIHRELLLGGTNSMLGIYQLLAALRRLAKWMFEEYKPWFMTEVLGE